MSILICFFIGCIVAVYVASISFVQIWTAVRTNRKHERKTNEDFKRDFYSELIRASIKLMEKGDPSAGLKASDSIASQIEELFQGKQCVLKPEK